MDMMISISIMDKINIINKRLEELANEGINKSLNKKEADKLKIERKELNNINKKLFDNFNITRLNNIIIK